MNIIRAIQEKYSLEDGYTEYRKLNTSVGDTSGEFVKSGIQHFIDVKDRLNFWSKGNVNTITYNVAECTWTLKIDYPNWGEEAEEEYTVSIDHERHRSIAPYQTYLPEEGKLLKLNPNESKQEDITPICRVTVYVSSEKESLQGYHRWYMGELREDFSIRTCNRRFNKTFKSNEYRCFTSPCNSTSRIKNGPYKQIFDKFEAQIVQKIKEEKKIRAKEKKDAIKKIKEDEKVVLNKYTLEYCSSYYNNKNVKKSCYAFKKGWVNILGVPQTWAQSRSLIKNIHTYCYRYLSTFLSGKDIQKLLCVNKKQHAEIRDINFLKAQVKELRNNITTENKQSNTTMKNVNKLRKQITHIEKSIHCLKKINQKDSDMDIEVLMKQMNKILKDKQIQHRTNRKEIRQQSFRLYRMKEKERVMYLMY